MAIPAHKQPPLEQWSAPVQTRVPPPLPRTSSEPPLQTPGGERRVLPVAFLFALLIHVFAAALGPYLFRHDGAVPRFPVPQARSSGDATELVFELGVPGVEQATDPTPSTSDAPTARPGRPPAEAPGIPAPSGAGSLPVPSTGAPAPGVPGVEPAAPDAPGVSGGTGLPARVGVERLRVGTPDTRLWRMDPSITDLTGEQLLRLELLWAIEDINAEAAAAAAAARSLTDWTYTDGDGKRWGFADGKVYLGDLVLPFPFAFGAAPNSPAAARAWVDAEIDRAAGSAAARETLKERVKAIRDRIDAERKRERADSTKVPPKP